MKTCNVCHENKGLTEFHRNRKMPDGHHRACKACRKVMKAPEEKQCPACERILPIAQFPVRVRRSRLCEDCSGEAPYRRWHLKTRYGMQPYEYRVMLKAQDSRCAICRTDDPGRYDRFVVDHCHETGEIRGLLCHSCNLGLGKFKDDTVLLEAAVVYLKGV